jgi:hypothetical protein
LRATNNEQPTTIYQEPLLPPPLELPPPPEKLPDDRLEE